MNNFECVAHEADHLDKQPKPIFFLKSLKAPFSRFKTNRPNTFQSCIFVASFLPDN